MLLEYRSSVQAAAFDLDEHDGSVTSVFLDFIRVVVDGDIGPGVPALAEQSGSCDDVRPTSAPHVRTSSHFSSPTSLTTSMRAIRRSTWLPQHFGVRVAELLVAHGADCRAKNRRGAEPLHYAADANRWDPTAQAETIEVPLSIGADPNAVDSGGVTPLHRAVRTRSLAAVRALLDGGADSRQPNKAGSTPLHLAVQTTGRGGSGSPQAREQQAGIIRLLLERGARVTDRDQQGKEVRQAATSEWIRALLREVTQSTE